jgi:hypothetical protein
LQDISIVRTCGYFRETQCLLQTGQEVQRRDDQQGIANALELQETQIKESLKYYEEKSKRTEQEYEESKRKAKEAHKKASREHCSAQHY